MTVKTNTTEAPLMLSVSGARGIVGVTMTPAVAADFAAAFGSFVRSTTGRASPLLCVGRDSRPSGEMLAAAAIAGLVSVGCRVVDLGIVATPTVGVMIGERKADGGLCITASHNPIQWNGIKCLNRHGLAPPKRDADEIIRRFQTKEIDFAPVEQLQSIAQDDAAHEIHAQRVLAQVDVKSIRAAKFKVVLDSVNGAGCVAGRMLLDRLGCEVVHMNGEPTGFFAHTPEPAAENLTELCAAVAKHDADVGFAQDPDADRLAIVDERGTYLGEEYTLVLAAKRVLDTRGGGVMATNLSTSRMIDDLAAKYEGAKVLRTAVGEANVAEAMMTLSPSPSGRGVRGEGDRSNCGDSRSAALLGGEGNGGVIFPPVCWVRDSLIAMALVLDMLAPERTHASHTLSAIVDEMPRYHMIKRKIDLTDLGGRDAVPGLLARAKKSAASSTGATINESDGVRIDYPDGWVHLRPSNTEPIVRIIAEAGSSERAVELADDIAATAGSR